MAAKESLLPDNGKPQILEKARSTESCIELEDQECDCDEIGYTTGDAVFSAFVVAPLVVAVWRCTWNIMDLHREYFPYAQTFLIGIVVHVSFALVRSQLLARSTGAWSGAKGGAGRWLRERVLSKIYTYIFVLSCLNHWRGGWGLLDGTIAALLPNEKDVHRPVLYAAFTIFFYLSAVLLRSSRNVLASPYFLFTDGKEATYIFTTRFNTTVSTLPLTTMDELPYRINCLWTLGVLLRSSHNVLASPYFLVTDGKEAT